MLLVQQKVRFILFFELPLIPRVDEIIYFVLSPNNLLNMPFVL